MKNKVLRIGIVSLLVAGVYYFTNSSDWGWTSANKIHEIILDANVVYTVERDQMGEFADLVVLGIPQDEIGDKKFEINYFPKDPNDHTKTPPAIQNFQAFTNFKVSGVYKNLTGVRMGEEIIISEPFALIKDADGKKKIKLGHFKELQAKQTYVLFLKKSSEHNYYHIIRDDEGQALISNAEDLESQVKSILQKHNVHF